MKETKLYKLFSAARKQEAPEVPFNFGQTVMVAIRRESRSAARSSLFDDLSRLFPRFAFASLLVISLSIAADMYFTHTESTLTDNVEDVANDWLFAAK